MRRSQGANPITGKALSVQPSGHPITNSRNCGFKVSAAHEQVGPGRNVTWTWGEEGQIARSFVISAPNVACSKSQNRVQAIAAPPSWAWFFTSNRSAPAPIVTPCSYLNHTAVGVGQQKESAPEVASADLSR